ncbi:MULTISPECIES: hypothetical protein [unclassified Moorena]|nr:MULTISPECIES: hypothetical protein [unclassified Moorena]
MQRGLGGFPHERLHQDKAYRGTKNPRPSRAGSVKAPYPPLPVS